MALISGCIHVKSRNLTKIITPCRSYDARIKLNRDTSYLIGIDQSTSCTGLFLLDRTMNFWIMLDFKRDDQDKELFFRDLEGFLRELLDDIQVSMVIHEEPIPSSIARTSAAVLNDLKGRLRTWIAHNPALQGAEVHSIYPQTWKSRVLDKKSLEARGLTVKQVCSSKVKMAKELCRYYPFFEEYRKQRFSTDYDSFDAVGILTGYLRYAHDDNGHRVICGMTEKRHKTIVCYRYVDKSELRFPDVVEDSLGGLRYALTPTLLGFNNNYNVMQNIKMASSNWNFVVTILPRQYIQPMQWLFDFREDPNKVMLMFIFRKGYLRDYNAVNTICESFPMHEEV